MTETAAITASDKAPYRSVRWVVAIVVLAANTMDLLDATIVNVAGPSIRRELGGGESSLQWLGAAYTLAFAVLLIAGARLGDIFGRRRMFLLGLAGFTLSSVACALGQATGMLIAFRALQGGFGALMIPQGFGMLKEVFDDEELGKATRLFGPATGLAMLGAPVLAGALIDANLWDIGWRLVFFINVPLGLIAFPLAVRSLPRSISHPDALMLTGTNSASIWLLVPGLFLVGVGVGTVLGQLILVAVSMNEVGSASGVMEASQQLATALGVAILGTIFLALLKHHPSTDALCVTSWACLAPLTAAFLLVFLLPNHAGAEGGH